MNALAKNWKRRLGWIVGGSLVVTAGYIVLLRWIDRPIVYADSPNRGILLAAAPVVVLFLAMVVAMRSLKGMDELERKMHTEAMAFGFLLSLLILSTAGFLALIGTVTLSLSWIAPTMVLSWIAGLLILSVRYR